MRGRASVSLFTVCPLAVASVVALGFSPLAHGLDWRTHIKKDMVRFEGGKMIHEGYDICKIGERSIQVKTYGEAPADGFMSRDYFIAMTVAYATLALSELEEFSCRPIASPIGEPELEFSYFMSRDGIKMEGRNNVDDKTQSQTLLWSDVFGSE